MTLERINECFMKLRKSDRAALVSFVMAGDPDRNTCASILDTLAESGADLIEIGMPFTDPMADGPVIQQAGLRALAAGADMAMTLSLVSDFRRKNKITPIILMGYYNPIYIYGTNRFAKDAAESGVDGLIIVDLPPEEETELSIPARIAGLALIRLVTPVTTESRLDTLLRHAEGFLYYVSITGVTGTAQADRESVAAHVAAIKGKTALPIVAGFGIRTPSDAAALAPHVDGIVVGSALVETIAGLGIGTKSLLDLKRQGQALAAILAR